MVYTVLNILMLQLLNFLFSKGACQSFTHHLAISCILISCKRFGLKYEACFFLKDSKVCCAL